MADSYVSNVFHCGYDNDTDTLYGALRNVSKQIRDVVNSNWESFPASGSLDDYDISAAVPSGGLWSGDFPVEAANDWYIYQVRVQAGDIPDYSDIPVFNFKGYWNGSIFTEGSFDTNGRVDVAKIEGSDATNQIRDAVLNGTGVTAGGTYDMKTVLKILAACQTGKVQDKSGSPGTYEVLDVEDGSTVIAEIAISETTPYRTISVS